ncbi:YecA family protein [Paenibacillus harenae]|uniref:YecA family protein n=1 Tax=Paenibacillus harenae TaxID=306543 RepID=UPI0004091879|nr:SEC-C metal-binding domain-containing protein [Paenibacillus harenae]
MSITKEIVPDKFWPALTYPLFYADALGSLTKQQLTNIRMNLDISNLSSLNKQGLVEKLSEKIPEHLWMITRTWDHERLKLAQKIAKNDGLWDKPLLELQQYEYFRERGILFPGILEGKRVVIMSAELVTLYKSGDFLQDHPIVSRNTEWIRLTHGLLYGYGVLTAEELERFVMSYSEHKQLPGDLMNILYEAWPYYERFLIEENGIVSDNRVVHSEALWIQRSQRHDLEFYPYTKQELLKIGEKDYVERNQHYMNLVRYVLEHYETDREDAELLVEECVDAAKTGDSLASIIEMAQDFIEMPSLESVAGFTDLLVPLMNNTKQWGIKGYAPMELSAKRAGTSMLLNSVSNQAVKADVIDFQTKKKIGRNDPCPCGSGKKYKKCCGQ